MHVKLNHHQEYNPVLARFLVHQIRQRRDNKVTQKLELQRQRNFIVQRQVEGRYRLQSPSLTERSCHGLSRAEFVEQFNQQLMNRLSDNKSFLSGNVAGLLEVQQVSIVSN